MITPRGRGDATSSQPAQRSVQVALPSVGASLLDATYPAGRDYDTHVHEEAHLCFVMKGSFDEWSGGRRKSLGAGGTVLYEAGSKHAVRTGCCGLRLLHVSDPDGSAWAGPPSPLRDGFLRQLAWEVQAAAPDELGDDGSRMHLESLVLELSGDGPAAHRPESWQDRARRWIRDGFAGPMSLAALADRVGVHRAHFARGFRQAHGMTAGDYLRRVRVAAAVRAIGDDTCPLSRIALECGFADQSHMGRYFKRYLGISPGAVRDRRWGSAIEDA